MVSAHSLEHMAESMILGGFVWEVYFCVEIGSFVPRFVSDSQEVVAATDAMNSYLGANVTYDLIRLRKWWTLPSYPNG